MRSDDLRWEANIDLRFHTAGFVECADQRGMKICSIPAFSAVLAFVATAHGQALSAPDNTSGLGRGHEKTAP